jgi:hypothetical protein
MTRRMTLIVLALVGLMVFVVTISPPDRGARNGSGATVSPTPPATSEPLTDPDAFDVSAELSAAPGVASKTVDAEIGDRVEITVEAPGTDSVSVGELAMKSVEPGIPARFELLADTAGTYPVVLVNENRRIGTLEIR